MRPLVNLDLSQTLNDTLIGPGVIALNAAPTHRLQTVWTVAIAQLKDTGQHAPAPTDWGVFAHAINSVFVISFNLGGFFGLAKAFFFPESCKHSPDPQLLLSLFLFSFPPFFNLPVPYSL